MTATPPLTAIGEVTVTYEDGHAVLHGPPGSRREREIVPEEAALRECIRQDDAGRYRPLSGARTLPRGWRLRTTAAFTLEDAIGVMYPLALEHVRLHGAGRLDVVPLRAVFERQAGRYQVAGELPDEAAEIASDILCGRCVRRPLWRGDGASGGDIPCPEPCSVMLSLCREAALWESEPPEPSDIDPGVPFAAFDAPGNEIREVYLRQRFQGAHPGGMHHG